MLNPLHLRTLAAVVRTGSFADAGRQLGYTGSAISQQMAVLERQLGLVLFERQPHGVRSTDAAEYIARRVPHALGALQELQDDIDHLSTGRRGRLRLGSFPTASERLLPAALSRFTQTRPEVEVSLDEGEPAELLPLVEARELDAALVYDYDVLPRRTSRPGQSLEILSEQLFVAMPPDHHRAGAPSVTIDELDEDVWVATREGTAAAAVLRRLCAAAGFEPKVSFRSNDYDVVHELVRAGLGLALVPALGYSSADGLAAVPLAMPRARRRVSVVLSQTAVEALTAEFVQTLRSAARDLATSGPGIQATPPDA